MLGTCEGGNQAYHTPEINRKQRQFVAQISPSFYQKDNNNKCMSFKANPVMHCKALQLLVEL